MSILLANYVFVLLCLAGYLPKRHPRHKSSLVIVLLRHMNNGLCASITGVRLVRAQLLTCVGLEKRWRFNGPGAGLSSWAVRLVQRRQVLSSFSTSHAQPHVLRESRGRERRPDCATAELWRGKSLESPLGLVICIVRT